MFILVYRFLTATSLTRAVPTEPTDPEVLAKRVKATAAKFKEASPLNKVLKIQDGALVN